VTASTLAMDSRPIWRSTWSRSCCTRSTISRAEMERPISGVAMKSPSVATEPLEVLRSYAAKFFIRKAAQLRQPPRGVDDESRLIAFAPLRYGRQIGGVGLHQQTVERYTDRSLANFLRLWKGDHAAEADVEAQVQRALRLGRRAGKAVHDAGQIVRSPVLFENREGI